MASVFLESAQVDEQGGFMVVRGVIQPRSYGELQIGPYQREAQPEKRKIKMAKALEAGDRFADLELGMRESDEWDTKGDLIILKHPIFVIDGQQRLGAAVILKTTQQWETDRFEVLNFRRTKVNANILVRNKRSTVPAIESLYTMSMNDSEFPLRKRVQWTQQAKGEDLLSAFLLLKVVGRLHSHLGPGRNASASHLVDGIQKIMETIGGATHLRANVRTLFQAIDEAWGIKSVMQRHGVTHLLGTFLLTLTDFFGRHENFWDGTKFVVEDHFRKRLASFKPQDPVVSQLSASGTQAAKMLYPMIRDHMARVGKKNALVERPNAPEVGEGDDEGTTD